MGKELTQAEMRLFLFSLFFALSYFVFVSFCAPVVISGYVANVFQNTPKGQVIFWESSMGKYVVAYEYNSSYHSIYVSPAIRSSSSFIVDFFPDGRITAWSFLSYNTFTHTYEFPDTCYWTTKDGYVYSTNVGYKSVYGNVVTGDLTISMINVSQFNQAYDSLYGAAIFQLYASNNAVYATVAAVPSNYSDCYVAYLHGALNIYVFPGAIYSAGNQTTPPIIVPSSLDIAAGLFNADFGGAISYPFNLLLCLPFWFCAILCTWIFAMKVLPDWM